MSSQRLDRCIRILIGVTFFIPLVVLPAYFIFPFIVPKILLFRSAVVLMTAAFVLLLYKNRARYRMTSSPLHVAVLLFFLTFVVSTFTGVDWYKSFWDNHERMLGVFTLFHYVLYYLIVSTVIRGWPEWQRFFRLFLGAGMLVMLVGLIQKISPDFLLNRGSVRISSTLGNPIYVSGYGLFLMMVGYLLFVRTKETAWRWFSVVGIALGFSGIIASGTRGSLLAFLVSLPVLLISYHFSLKGEGRRIVKWLSIMIAAGGVLLGVLFFFRETGFVKQMPGIGRLYETSFHEFLGSARAQAWGIAFESWKERPILGWGPNNFFYAFNKHYTPKFLEYGWGETWFDNAHNIVMNTMADRGIVGLIIYIGLFVTAAVMLVRAFRKGKIDPHLLSIGMAFLAAHFVHNVFVFENPTSYLYFFFFLAFLHEQTGGAPEAGSQEKRTPSSFLIGGVWVIAFLIIWMTNIGAARANTKTLRAVQFLSLNRTESLALFDQALSLSSPHVDDIRNDFARSVAEAVIPYVQAGQTQFAAQLIDRSLAELQKNRVLHPLDIRVNVLQSQLLILSAQLTGKAFFYDQAVVELEDALIKSPQRQQLYYQLAAIQFERGQADKAIELLRTTIEADSNVGEGWWRLASVYQLLDMKQEALAVFEEADVRGARFDANGKQVRARIIAALAPASTTN